MCVVFLSGYEFFAIVVSCWGRCSDILYFVTIFLQIVAVDECRVPDIILCLLSAGAGGTQWIDIWYDIGQCYLVVIHAIPFICRIFATNYRRLDEDIRRIRYFIGNTKGHNRNGL